ncbi:hypothetical protein N644_2330 [Lactiplantibacillus paraplantarum]|nr:hypothetical protein N644_2330 [Lactiplantibacillus paraplantarum]
MSCELCHGSKVVQQLLGSYGFMFGPCPNCTNEIHDHYEQELERKLAYGEQKLA